MDQSLTKFKAACGRGVSANPAGRFESQEVEADAEAVEALRVADADALDGRVETRFFRDESQSIISRNESPDLSFRASLNPYRGCEHGCAYCYARPYHEYLGFGAGLDFETRIMVKPEAPALLEEALSRPNWEPQPLACSGVTDCYQPVERELEITRGCLEVLARFRNPVTIVTKNRLVTRDSDWLTELAHYRAGAVLLSITTLDGALARRMEPRAASPGGRLAAVRELSEAGIPVGVSLAPVIPGLNDHEIPSILEAAKDHGAVFAAYTVLRLPYGVKDLFFGWLEREFPDRFERVEGRMRELRGGSLNDHRFGSRMKGEGPIADQIRQLFEVSARRCGFMEQRLKLSTDFFRRAGPEQLLLF